MQWEKAADHDKLSLVTASSVHDRNACLFQFTGAHHQGCSGSTRSAPGPPAKAGEAIFLAGFEGSRGQRFCQTLELPEPKCAPGVGEDGRIGQMAETMRKLVLMIGAGRCDMLLVAGGDVGRTLGGYIGRI